ncbi:carbonic anhydrase [Chroococcidiopsis sp. CCNUC1]|jgi:carbonic anhydrase|uniref:carbonic anhydrase n=1 Tax=Chroococcidiopsis sp. CCNUC1 TaxID=2653189 RepID=UPI0020213E5E|nr:carbonic anhydrase [Chroococcidiopsis sp. CCNUC1]URD49981.1 carbonic anhydrase [Chroococcidiopsis sp. CCNUC1]
MSRQNKFVDRRQFLKIAGVGFSVAASSLLGYARSAQAVVIEDIEPDSPNTALQRLLAGNQRFVQQKLRHPHQSQTRLHEVATAQHPFATLLSCADSRVPAEILFDLGIGDLFDVRIAGNIVTTEALGSLEYAAAMLGTPLIMVLGHERCGAVTAAVQGKPLPGQISSFAKAIEPAITTLSSANAQLNHKSNNKSESDLIENAVVANVQYQVKKLERSDLLMQLVGEGKLKIVGGRYDLDTGEVAIVT